MDHEHLTTPATSDACCCGPKPSSALATSRRALLTASAAIAAGAAAAPLLAGAALAQSAAAPDADRLLARAQGARRILIKGGLVLSLDPAIGDFAQADVLIEDGKIRELRPDIAASGDDVAVIDAVNRIVLPGFIDTHHHFYQGLLRGVLTNGLLNPDYNRDIANTLTPAYAPADAYAGVLVTALGMIDMGTTTAVDTSQVSHTPEHSDACIRALQESGIRAVYAYWRGSGPDTRYPQDIVRLRRSYFNSQDQLLTLALGALLDANTFAYAREVGVHCVSHGVNSNTERFSSSDARGCCGRATNTSTARI